MAELHRYFHQTLLVWGLLFGTNVSGQFKVDNEGRVFIDSVYVVESTASPILYERAKEWMLRNMKSADNQVSLDDELKAKLIGTTNLLLPDRKASGGHSTDRVLNFKLSVFCKDGRYKVIVENVVYSFTFNIGMGANPVYYQTTLEERFADRKKWQDQKKKKRVEAANETIADLEVEISKLLTSLYRTMSATESDDW